MHSLYYKPTKAWFGDCMPVFAKGKFYLYHQRDTRNPIPLFGEPFGWSLVTTTDFVHFEDHGESLKRGGDDDQDQYIFAGSVFEANGSFYAMYTGYNHNFVQQNKPSQVLMIAESDDLITWNKTDEKLVPPQPGYDPDNWRDPFVLWDEENQNYLMILGARKDGEKILSGSTVAFRSEDLKHWQFEGDLWAPDLYTMHEMPDLFRMGDYWYLLTTEYSDKSKTIYRMSKSLDGPWTAPVDDAFDGRAYYAARSASDGEHRYLFGWVPTKTGDDDEARWDWGGTLVVHEVFQREDGSLGVKPPATVEKAFATPRATSNPEIEMRSDDGETHQTLVNKSGNLIYLEGNLVVEKGTRSVSIRIYEDPVTGESYEFLILPGEQRLLFDRRPNFPWYQYDNKGMERPLTLEPGVSHKFQLIVDESVATFYISGVALNARMNRRFGDRLSVGVTDGGAVLNNLRFSQELS
ncbi:glycoside hydrolase family protein [Actinomyces urinae]|uniref:family 43 glycosylhydrolase n=1 Tax=Actinomyces urinae TaxID=1689268 RepID=UPI00092FF530|nr:family 43 glycosylhydrolase [Actinomyces urinae]